MNWPLSAAASAAESALDPLPEVATAGDTHGLPLSPDPTSRWERRGELAAGGMGLVTIVHDRWLDRDIAVKVPHTEQDRSRLLREARITASLDHPGIVSVFDTGYAPTGEPWFAMRLVRGRSLADAIADPETHLEALLRHILAAAEAVGYAHNHGVIHRDLKPANIMVGPFGETQVIDWGLALDGKDSPDGPRAGTPSAMSPEQARREPIDVRADVYALGMVLFEAVLRAPPYPPTKSREEILQSLARDEVPLLPATLSIAPELRAIVTRATHRDATQRYPDAKTLADDLARHLEGRRVTAHSYSASELFRRLLRLWRVPLVLSAIALGVIAIILVIAFTEVASERDLSEQRLGHTLVDAARRALHEDDRGAAEVLALEALVRGDFPEARGVLLALPRERPIRSESPLTGCNAVDLQWPDRGPPLILCLDPTSIAVKRGDTLLWQRPVAARGAVFIERGGLVLIQHDGYRIERVDALTGASRDELISPCHFGRLEPGADRATALHQQHGCALHIDKNEARSIPINACRDAFLRVSALTVDGRQWAGVCGEGGVILRDLLRGTTTRVEAGLPVSPSRPLPTALALRDHQTLLIGDSDGGVTRLDVDALPNRQRIVLHATLVRHIDVSPDMRLALIRYEDGPLYVLDLERWSSLGRLPPRPGVGGAGYGAIEFGPDNQLFATSPGRLEGWDFSAVRIRELAFSEGITDLALDDTATTLAVGHAAHVSFVDAARRAVTSQHRWQSELVRTMTFAPSRPGTLSTLAVGTLGLNGLHLLRTDGTLDALPFTLLVRKVVPLGHDRFIISGYGRNLFVLGRGVEPVTGPDLIVEDHTTSPDGQHLAILDTSHRIWVVSDSVHGVASASLANGTTLQPLTHITTHIGARKVGRVDDDHVVVLDRDGLVEFDTTGRELTLYRGNGHELSSLAVSHTIFAAGSRQGSVHLWQRGRPEPLAIVADHDRRVDELAIAPDGSWLAAGDWNGRVLFVRTTLAGDEPHDAARTWGLTLEDLVSPR